MRLIDADELIKRMRKWMPKDPCGREQTVEEVVATDIAASVFMEIEETPTAFDKEKVIEELVELRQREYNDSDEESETMDGEEIYDEGRSQGRFEAYHRAIEIVEKGGIE